jgi:hypothetical protein
MLAELVEKSLSLEKILRSFLHSLHSNFDGVAAAAAVVFVFVFAVVAAVVAAVAAAAAAAARFVADNDVAELVDFAAELVAAELVAAASADTRQEAA